MAVLPQLIDAETYRPCEWDLKHDAAGRRYWVDLFREHLTYLLDLIRAEYADAGAARLEAFRRDYLAMLDVFLNEPARFERMDIIRLTELRRAVQRRHGFKDPFRGIKQRENEAALALWPAVVAEADATPAERRLRALAGGLMAGNVFDLGSPATVARYQAGELQFENLRREQAARPWLVDDVGAWAQRWISGGGYRRVLFFVDNCGADIWLGCLPLVRWMLEQGATVTLAANSGAALNDVTADELNALLPRAAEADAVLADGLARGALSVVASGSSLPLLDLSRLSQACARAAAGADLIILHGMGRAVESNAHARFRCDAVWSAVLKDPAVAARIGGRLFDCLLRFRRAAAPH